MNNASNNNTMIEALSTCKLLSALLTGIRASGTYVTMSQGQWQRTQLPKDYVHLVRMTQVRVYACCHLSRYIVSVMSCTLVLSP